VKTSGYLPWPNDLKGQFFSFQKEIVWPGKKEMENEVSINP
jgi:hypothetical protein